MGGCHSLGTNYDCCEYNLTVFDGKKQEESVLEFDGIFYHIHHGTLQETSPGILLQYNNMKILFDEQWELQILLSKIKDKKEQIFNAYIKNCLVDATVCITKTKNGLDSDPYASTWLKCAAFFLADAISNSELVDGTFEERMGIFRDANDDVVAFSGTSNVTFDTQNRNFESIDVFTSWDDKSRVDIKINNFENLWTNKTKYVQVYDLLFAERSNLLKYSVEWAVDIN